jgi:hypothetical protein
LRAILLASFTMLYVAALAVTSFLRQMSHSGAGTDVNEFIARANAEMWRLVAIETIIYAAACTLVLWPRKKN